MISLRAAQHIYTNVERDQSPAKTAGFQTLFYTHDELSSDDVFAIEERVFYRPEPGIAPKRFFFVAPSGKWVIGNIVSVDGVDYAGRAGLYLAHSFIFSEDEALAHNIDPMTLIRSASFITSREDALARGDSTTGNIDALSIDVEHSTPPRLDDSPFTRALAQLALKTELLRAEKKALALVGSATEIERALDTAFALMPAASMSAGSFDTAFDHGGNLGFTYCWATGHTEPPHHPFFIRLNVDSRDLPDSIPESKPSSAYGRWIDTLLASHQGASIAKSKEQAWVVAEYFDGKNEDASLESTPEEILASVLEANREELDRRLREHISDTLPDVLIDRIFDPLINELSSSKQLRFAKEGFEPAFLLDFLLNQYEKSNFAPPTKVSNLDEREVEALQKTVKTHDHEALSLLALCWQKDVVALRKELKNVESTTYDRAWEMLVDKEIALPIWFLVKGKEAQFASKLSGTTPLDGSDTAYAIRFFAKQNTLEMLDVLIDHLPKLNKNQLRKSYKTIHDAAGVPQSFTDTLQGIMKEQNVSMEGGFFKRWF